MFETYKTAVAWVQCSIGAECDLSEDFSIAAG
jgi:hypothetical protein